MNTYTLSYLCGPCYMQLDTTYHHECTQHQSGMTPFVFIIDGETEAQKEDTLYPVPQHLLTGYPGHILGQQGT